MSYQVFIENEAGSDQKNLYNEKTLEYRKTVTVSLPYPLAYGFVLNTTSGDGDNVDCFVLTKKDLKTGDIIEVTPIGLMEQLEDGDIDHNILAVPTGETVDLTDETKEQLQTFVKGVFAHLPDKQMEVGRFLDAEAAIEMIEQYRDT